MGLLASDSVILNGAELRKEKDWGLGQLGKVGALPRALVTRSLGSVSAPAFLHGQCTPCSVTPVFSPLKWGDVSSCFMGIVGLTKGPGPQWACGEQSRMAHLQTCEEEGWHVKRSYRIKHKRTRKREVSYCGPRCGTGPDAQ